MRIIAYTYEADVHCVECASKRFNLSPAAASILEMRTDKEGNEVRAVFSTDEQLEPLSCGDCHELITEPTRSRQPVTLLVGEL